MMHGNAPVVTGPLQIPASPGFPWWRLALLVVVPVLLILVWVVMGIFPQETTTRPRATGKVTRSAGKNHLDGLPTSNMGVAEADSRPAASPPTAPAAPAAKETGGVDQEALIAHLREDNRRLNALARQSPGAAKTSSPNQARAVDPQVAERRAEAKRLADEQRKEAEAARKTMDIWTAPKDQPTTGLKGLRTPYSLPPGTEIACQTERQITNQVQGSFRGYVTRPVRAANGAIVLPAMSRLLMRSAKGSVFGDEWLAIEITTVTFPDDTYVEFTDATVGDDTSAAGFKDQVDRRIGTALLGSVLTGALRGGSAIVSGVGVGTDAGAKVAGSVVSETASQGSQQVRQHLRSDPILTIRAGHACHLLLSQEMVLSRGWPDARP